MQKNDLFYIKWNYKYKKRKESQSINMYTIFSGFCQLVVNLFNIFKKILSAPLHT